MATNMDDTGYDIPDPYEVAQGQDNLYQKAMLSGNTQAQLSALVNHNSADNIAQVNRAKAVSDRMKSILAETAGNDPNEDALTKNLRIATAMSAGMADLDPKIAMQANQQALRMQQAQTQQQALTTKVAEEKLKLQQDKAGQVYQVHSVEQGKDGLPEYKAWGDAIPMYDQQGNLDPEFTKKLQAAVVAAKDAGATNPTWMTTDKFANSKDNVAMIRANAALQSATLKAQMQQQNSQNAFGNEDALKTAVVNYALDPSSIARVGKDGMIAIQQGMAKYGITSADALSARLEKQALMREASNIGGRQGNLDWLENSIPGAANIVSNNLDKVDRTRFPLINRAIVAGKDFVGTPEEKQLAASIQTFVNEYARIVSGATGRTTDTARNEAADLISKADNPAAAKAVLNTLAKQELDVARGAGDAALEMIRNPQKYKALTKIQNKLGISMTGEDPDFNKTESQIPGQLTPPLTSSSQDKFTVGKQYKDKNGTVKTYKGNGQWE